MKQLLEETLWGIVENFYTSAVLFQSEYKKYEDSIKNFSKTKKIALEKLVKCLDMEEVQSLLSYDTFSRLLEGDLSNLKYLCELFVKEQFPNSLFSYYINDIFHELSILRDECEKLLISAPHYVSHHEEEECKSILEEMHVFLPLKMLHLSHLYKKARTELENLLLKHNSSRILVRSLYLFGSEVISCAYSQGIEQFFGKIYKNGIIEAYIRAAHSFSSSGFFALAQEAFIKADISKRQQDAELSEEVEIMFVKLEKYLANNEPSESISIQP